MKKTTMMRIAATLLIAVLLTTCAIGATFAKYATKATGSDSARVAVWNVSITKDGTQAFAVNLFDTINSTDGNAETNVDTGLIAPGTQGQFTFQLSADNEVTTDYTIDYEVTNGNNIPIKFKVGEGEWLDTLADVSDQLSVNEAFNDTITVYWKWDFGGVDASGNGTDNVYGTDDVNVTVAVTVTFDQVD